MTRSPSAVRRHRVFAVAAVVHAALVFAGLFQLYAQHHALWFTRLWVGAATLWFFWPLILGLAAGSSRRRAYVAAAASALLLALPMHAYLTLFAPVVLAGANGPLSFHPYDLGSFVIGSVNGWRESNDRSREETIVIESYGMAGDFTPGMPPLAYRASQQFKIKREPIADCVIDSYIKGHAAGYNTASGRVLRRRYGSNIISVLEREWALEQERVVAAGPTGRADAERDINAGQLALKVLAEHWAAGSQVDMDVLVQYGVALQPVIDGIDASPEVLRHTFSYNGIMEDELRRRFSADVANRIVETTARRYLYPAGSH